MFELGVPVLGICYGMQTMAEQLGGQVEPSSRREFGYAQVRVTASSRLLDGIRDHVDEDGAARLDVWMSHGDKVMALPADFELIATTDSAPIAAMATIAPPFYGIQFHPEVTHTLQGGRILEHFVREHLRLRGAVDAGQHRRRRDRHDPHHRRQRQGVARACPAVSIPRWWPRCCTARSATS